MTRASRFLHGVLVGTALLGTGPAFAAPRLATTAPSPRPAGPAKLPIPEPDPADAEDDDRPPSLEEQANRIRDLEIQLEQTRELVANRRPSITLGGYVDFGFFVPQGNGSGIVRDNNNVVFPEHKGRYGWVFLGDLLAPTVNSRGEAADLGDAAGARRFDSVHSRGAPGFLANEINLTLSAGLTEKLLATASVNLVPRSGSDFSVGDFIDVDLAQVEWMLGDTGRTSIFVGKMDPVIGIEYRDRKASQRFGITPSLLARYTVGTALGLKIRSKIGPNDLLVIAAALTNGSTTTEQFHFYDEVDSNAGKTASGRIALRPPLPFDLEIGVSGEYGAQDRARDSGGAMWFAGVDLLAHVGTLDLKAQWLTGGAPGRSRDAAYGIDLHTGAYLEANWMLAPWLGFLGRGELRDAFVWQGDPSAPTGANRAYVTKSWRATAGVRVVFTDRIVLKAEYLHNGEYGGIPSIANDVFTSSLVFMN